MDKVTLTPYIFFKGNCKEAMDFYKSLFGGELAVQKMSDVPDMPKIDGMSDDMIMHARLHGGAVEIMASDSPKASAEAKKVSLSLGGKDEEKMRKMFDQLSEGGKVFSELKKEFWGDIFGMVTDKYGVEWMMNIGTSMQ